MKQLLRWVLIGGLAVIYVLTMLAVLHPKVSLAYRAHFIDHTSTEWNPPHYRSAPEDGFVFAQPGLPDWVAWTYGFTRPEPMGRWTDDDLGNKAGLVFDRPFKGTFCLEFNAEPASHMSDSFALKFGESLQTVPVAARSASDYQIQFRDVKDARQLEFILPKDLPRVHDFDLQNGDDRRLGLLLRRLKIHPGNCDQAH